jgi:signal transduction histidine kinase
VEDQVHGTGLGLNLVKGIVEAHGGTVTVKSAAGKGTEFQILLPAAPDGYQDEFTNSAH